MSDKRDDQGMTRRDFMVAGAVGLAAASVASAPGLAQAAEHKLPPLPYAETALEPVVSAKTIGFHHGKHHAAYVTNLNNLIKGTPLAEASLEEIVKVTAGDPAKAGVFNNAAQVWNHTFYWQSMRQGGGGQPGGELAAKITADLGGYDKFREAFTQAALTQFGSGWAWLALDGGKLVVLKTPNAETPMSKGIKPLITIDVWEHAYYLDYQNRRGDYIKDWLDKLVNWDFAAKNLKG